MSIYVGVRILIDNIKFERTARARPRQLFTDLCNLIVETNAFKIKCQCTLIVFHKRRFFVTTLESNESKNAYGQFLSTTDSTICENAQEV